MAILSRFSRLFGKSSDEVELDPRIMTRFEKLQASGHRGAHMPRLFRT